MTKSTTTPADQTPKPECQSERFMQAACDLECDEDEAAWDERLKRVAKPKPAD
jgi:hypothetical protein